MILFFIRKHNKSVHTPVDHAALAQLGERQTEDLKVPGSIPGGGIFFPWRTEIFVFKAPWPSG